MFEFFPVVSKFHFLFFLYWTLLGVRHYNFPLIPSYDSHILDIFRYLRILQKISFARRGTVFYFRYWESQKLLDVVVYNPSVGASYCKRKLLRDAWAGVIIHPWLLPKGNHFLKETNPLFGSKGCKYRDVCFGRSLRITTFSQFFLVAHVSRWYMCLPLFLLL